MVLKINGELLGAHVHAYVYSGPSVDKLALCGKLTFREGEYPEFVRGITAKSVPDFEVRVVGYLAPSTPA